MKNMILLVLMILPISCGKGSSKKSDRNIADQNPRCGEYKQSDQWQEPIENGIGTFTCQKGNKIQSGVTECSPGFEKVDISCLKKASPKNDDKITFNENDLSITETVNLGANLYAVTATTSGLSEVYFKIHHSYTNTLDCSMSVVVKIKSESGNLYSKKVDAKNIAVYPKQAFGEEGSFQLSLGLSQGEELADDFSNKYLAECHGWDASIPLPDSLCLSPKYNPGHQKACSLLINGQKLYPWIRNGAWIGSCRCD